MFQKVLNFSLISFVVSIISMAAIADVEVPQDELAQETVYPVFDNPVSVKNRNIRDIGTVDVGFFGGLALTEPIYNTSKVGIAMNYHFSETHSLGVMFAKNSTGLSVDAQGLKNDFGLDYTRAPYPEYSMMADYNYKLYYGKLSLTKVAVMNTSIYLSSALGIVKYVHKSYPAIALGVGERFYFTNHLSLKLDLRFYAHQAPIPFLTGALRDGSKGPSDPIPSYDSFQERLTYTTNLELGLNYLF
ncbi:MAG: outer membrane beta-barrel domain-containing protein [Bdellovibrionales bacterium RIFCSPHIGHO2_01_FULL_40_29]|nr:MAG: outer membrane beta-barrel domain-containing protein [Bdellovibrionales bacterium RIFCSPHIGHO2_01_FULL_40_29]OFZ35475.1 MAG: outer membrane beta-barrel domain-containing protein [Bdellovibrionales bacterium RIFCSPHIGHO2_02_FULL_40_15]